MSDRYSAESEGSTSDLNGQDIPSSGRSSGTRSAKPSSESIGPKSRSMETSPRLTRNGLQASGFSGGMGAKARSIGFREGQSPTLMTAGGGNQVPMVLISSAADSPAKTSPLPEEGQDSQGSDQDCSLRQPESLTLFSAREDGFSSKMCPDYFPQTVDEISESFSRRWPNSGFTTSLGECWTLSTSEWPKEGGAYSSLLDGLEADVPPRFYVSQRAMSGVLSRAEKRGKRLPKVLELALMDQSKQSGTLRRLTPTECERLQGFPDGWTLP